MGVALCSNTTIGAGVGVIIDDIDVDIGAGGGVLIVGVPTAQPVRMMVNATINMPKKGDVII